MAEADTLRRCVKDANVPRSATPWCIVHDAPFSALDPSECLGRYLDEEV